MCVCVCVCVCVLVSEHKRYFVVYFDFHFQNVLSVSIDLVLARHCCVMLQKLASHSKTSSVARSSSRFLSTHPMFQQMVSLIISQVDTHTHTHHLSPTHSSPALPLLNGRHSLNKPSQPSTNYLNTLTLCVEQS